MPSPLRLCCAASKSFDVSVIDTRHLVLGSYIAEIRFPPSGKPLNASKPPKHAH